MSRDLVLYIAMSLDGYIAKKDGSVDWLALAEDDSSDHGYADFLKTVDTLIMGRKTYDQIIHELSPDRWVYTGKACYVASGTLAGVSDEVRFIAGDLVKFVSQLKQTKGQDIWLVGGSKVIEPFVSQNQIDKYIITVIPVILGSGIPLFTHGLPQTGLELLETKSAAGLSTLIYSRKQK